MPDSMVTGDHSKCRLCAARVACDIITATGFELNGFDRFSRDRDICDACLRVNYSWHWVWGTLAQWFALTVGGFLSVSLSMLMALRIIPVESAPARANHRAGVGFVRTVCGVRMALD